jgi:hypothetical protein
MAYEWTFTEEERIVGIQQLRTLQERYKPHVIARRSGISPAMQLHLLRNGTPYPGMLEKIETMYAVMVRLQEKGK